MPPKKANPKPDAAATEDSNEVDHADAYFDRLNVKIEEVGAKGFVFVVGIEPEDEEDEDDDEDDNEDDADEEGGEKEDKEKVYTKEQMDSLRVIIANARRVAELDKAKKMVTCAQSGCCMMFNTHTGNVTIMEVLRWTKTAKAKKTLPEKFDCLFGLTYQLLEYDFWARDNELWGPGGELEQAVVGLGKAWSDLLSHTDAELGIDAEYTRPGIEALLDKFAENFNDVLAQSGSRLFKWDKYKTAPKKAAPGPSKATSNKTATAPNKRKTDEEA